MMKGVVKWFSEEKRYGFIGREEGEDVFVHISDINPGTRLDKGDDVEFEVEEAEKGPRAKNVRKPE